MMRSTLNENSLPIGSKWKASIYQKHSNTKNLLISSIESLLERQNLRLFEHISADNHFTSNLSYLSANLSLLSFWKRVYSY